MPRVSCVFTLLVLIPLTWGCGAQESHRVVTDADGLSCRFSQDMATSMGLVLGDVHDQYTDPRPPANQSGGLFNGTMWSIANHFKCKDKAGKEAEIELKNKVPNLSADIENGKVALRTKDFGTVYWDEDHHTLEMADGRIKKLKTSLGF
jgi:hypothetical protein